METIAAISTPPAVGGIAMIRISGDAALQITEQMFYARNGVKVTQMRGYSCAYGVVCDGDEMLDDVILTVFRSPHSYTGEDTVEITCHGGLYVSKRILGVLYRLGAAPAGAGEFTKRAFLNGKLSLSQAEAVMDVIAADNAASLRLANTAKEGRLGREMRRISEEITDLLSALAYWLDDAEECPPELNPATLTAQITGLQTQIGELSRHYEEGRVVREGIRTVLLGLPNAGKSTVMNWLCGTRRSIVTEYAGTTRDVITEQVKIGEFTMLLSDTAGIRETENPIESIGIEQAYFAMEQADLVLYIVDSARGWSDEDAAMLSRCEGKRVILLWNKADLPHEEPPEMGYPVLTCDAIHEPATDMLSVHLRTLFGDAASCTMAALNERQQALLQQADAHLSFALSILTDDAPLDMLYTDLERAAESLRAIEGENVTEDVIDGVFSRFCVGK